VNATSRWLNLATAVLVLGLALAVPAGAELADVYLKNGLALRGEVQLTETEVVLRNVLGEVRIPRAAVARVVAVGAAPLPVPLRPADAPTTETLPAPEDKDAEAHEGAEAEVEADADAPATELPLPLLSALDIQRVRMSELRLDGPAENVRVDFGSAAAHDRLVGEVLERLRQDPDLDALWRTKLLEGTPAEQLQVIAALPGTERPALAIQTEEELVFGRAPKPLYLVIVPYGSTPSVLLFTHDPREQIEQLFPEAVVRVTMEA